MTEATDTCANCESEVGTYAYCPACGQPNRDPVPTMRDLFGQFLDDFLSLDSKLVRTLRTLVTRPGELTVTYLQGRQQLYVRPLRLYLLCSLLFFLIVSMLDVAVFQTNVDESGERAATTSTAPAPADSTRFDDLETIPLVGPRLASKARALGDMDAATFQDAINDELVTTLPKAVFCLVPVFALALAVLYRRSRRRYAEHFVLALHLHAFGFLVLAVSALIDFDPVEILLLLGLPVHAFLALRRVYGQGRRKTFVKLVGLGSGYTVLLFVALVLAVFVSFLIL